MDQAAVVYPPVEIYISSNDAVRSDDTFHNDCTFQLSRNVIAPAGYSIYLQVLSFTMPHCMHVVSLYNNRLKISDHDFTLEPGNYSIYQLVAVLNKLDPNVSCRFDSITLKCIFTSATSCTIDGPLCKVLGIPAGSRGTTIASTQTVDLSGCNSIYVLTDLTCSNANLDSRADAGNLLCRIPISVPPAGIIEFTDFSGRSGLLLDSDALAGSFRIQLQDEDRRPLLCSLAWQMCLQCRFIYTERQAMIVDRPAGLRMPI